MKRIATLFAALLCTVGLFAQTPEESVTFDPAAYPGTTIIDKR